jgi:hypothetical protein
LDRNRRCRSYRLNPASMNHLVFNATYLTVNNVSTNNRFQGAVEIKSELDSLPIDIGDQYHFLDQRKKTYLFSHTGIIEKVSDPTILPYTESEKKKNEENAAKKLPPVKQTYLHRIGLAETKALTENNVLGDLAYSLRLVFRYIKPYKHFESQYRKLPKEDFETIEKGMLYVARTGFGKLINAIPRENRLEFTLLAMKEWNTIDFRKVPYLEGLDFLQAYISQNFLQKGRILVGIKQLLSERLSQVEGLQVQQVGFTDSDGKEDNVYTQATYFEELFKQDDNFDLIAKIKAGAVSNDETESRFQKLFKSITWPIDISI